MAKLTTVKNMMVHSRFTPMLHGPGQTMRLPLGPACILALCFGAAHVRGAGREWKHILAGATPPLLIAPITASSFAMPVHSFL